MATQEENQEPAGSVPANPIVDNTPIVEAPTDNDGDKSGEGDKSNANDKKADNTSKLEAMLAESQAMIGKQSTEVGALRQQIAQLTPQQQQEQQPSEPNIADQIDEISAKMEDGDIGLREGNKAIAVLSAKMGEQNALQMFQQQQSEEKVMSIQQKFLQDNPDFEELRDNGTLQNIVDSDPMADVYSAYQQVKAQQKMDDMQTSFAQEKEVLAAKIPEAKEEGAKLAQGATEAGKVLGKNGTAARAAAVAPKPFANRQDAESAMMATLKQMRSQ